MIRDSKQTEPDKPWYLWFCPGANHAPHHAPEEYIAKYEGIFDDGYEAYREWVLPRMIERGILPEGTELTPINPMPDGTYAPGDYVRPWEELNAQERRLFSRMAEVYAGFSEYTDAQVGRIVDYLEESGQLDNTIIFYCADNGASGEGSPNGSTNEGKFINGYPDTIEDNLAAMDVLGSPDTYNHYPTGWATAFSTPYRMFKRYTYQGGVCDPLVVHWPKGIAARGEVQAPVPPLHRHRADDLRGLWRHDARRGGRRRADAAVRGVDGLLLRRRRLRRPTKRTQYYEMFGNRGIWHDGWKAVTEHGPISGMSNFDQDTWQLFHTDVDRAEAHDLAAEHPEKLQELVALWFEEAKANNVLPLNDMQVAGKDLEAFLAMEFNIPVPPSGQYTYYPGTSEVPERSAANVHGVSYKVLAEVEFTPRDERGHLRPRLPLRRAHPVRPQDGRARLRLQLPRDPTRGPGQGAGTQLRTPHRRRRLHQGVDGRAPRLARDPQAVRRRRGHRPGRRLPHHDRSLLAVRGGVVHRLRQRRCRLDRVRRHAVPLHRGTLTKVVFDVADDAYVDVEKHLWAAMVRD